MKQLDLPLKPTTGELIRALKPFYKTTYDLTLAVNEHRRANGFKNWHVAAEDLLQGWEEYGGDEAQYEAFLHSLIRYNRYSLTC